MVLFPAIDLYEGKAVRLYKGDYAQMTVYSERPEDVAADFAACGAQYIHMVDLQGARGGGTPNLDVVRRVVQKTGLFVQLGGGIRDEETAQRCLDAGVSRVILGTAAVESPELTRRLTARFGERIAVSVDIRDGMAAVRGWKEKSAVSCEALMARLAGDGVQTVICTDISRDGAMQGTNLDLYARLSREYPMKLIASGGVSSMDNVTALRDMGLYGAIIGKAYYTGAIDLRRAIEVCA